MLNAKEILDRIAVSLKIESDAEMARLFNFHQANLKNWRDRNTIAWSMLFELCEKQGWSFDWLLTGKEKENINSTEGHNTSSNIHPDVLEILECDDEDLKSDMISYAKRLKERKAEREERRAMKALLEEMAAKQRDDAEKKKISNSPTDDPESTVDDLGGPEMGVWRF
jgi:hypothetical protein